LFEHEPGFAATASLEEIAANGSNLSIPLYVKRSAATSITGDLPDALREWRESSSDLRVAASELIELLDSGMVRS
jgi:type I restriction enzyme M protein